jgi:hypothetical protein
MDKDPVKKQQIRVRYSETSAQYASQVLINTTAEDVTLNFSSGPISDPSGADAMLPIHTRIAMTRGAARRLYQALGSALKQQESAAANIPAAAQSQIPKVKH